MPENIANFGIGTLDVVAARSPDRLPAKLAWVVGRRVRAAGWPRPKADTHPSPFSPKLSRLKAGLTKAQSPLPLGPLAVEGSSVALPYGKA